MCMHRDYFHGKLTDFGLVNSQELPVCWEAQACIIMVKGTLRDDTTLKKKEYVNEVAGKGQSRLTSILSARLWENESLATLGNQTCFSIAPGFSVQHSTNGNSLPQSKLWSLITSLCTLWGYPPRWIACWPEGHEGPCVTCQASSMPGSTALCNTYPHTVSLLLLLLSGSSPQSS